MRMQMHKIFHFQVEKIYEYNLFWNILIVFFQPKHNSVIISPLF